MKGMSIDQGMAACLGVLGLMFLLVCFGEKSSPNPDETSGYRYKSYYSEEGGGVHGICIEGALYYRMSEGALAPAYFPNGQLKQCEMTGEVR